MLIFWIIIKVIKFPLFCSVFLLIPFHHLSASILKILKCPRKNITTYLYSYLVLSVSQKICALRELKTRWIQKFQIWCWSRFINGTRISSLKNAQGVSTNKSTELLNIAKTFYESLYSASVMDSNSQNTFLSNILFLAFKKRIWMPQLLLMNLSWKWIFG